MQGQTTQIGGKDNSAVERRGDKEGGTEGNQREAVGAGHRAYRREIDSLLATTQSTLTDMWGGVGMNTRSWSEDIEARMQEQEKGSQNSALSYV